MKLAKLSVFNAFLLGDIFAGESCSELKAPSNFMQSVALAKRMLRVSPYNYIAINEMGPVGLCQLVPDPRALSVISVGLMVTPSMRRKGLGGQLLDIAIEEAKKIGGQAVTGDTDVTNSACLGLFKSRGFTVSGAYDEKVFFSIKDI